MTGRRAGVLLHPTSLPGPYGSGDLGRGARDFIDFLADAGQSLWQVLPLHPAGPGDSPYQAHSAFAGAPILIDVDELCDLGLVEPVTRAELQTKSRRRCDFGHAVRARSVVLEEAFAAVERGEHDEARALGDALEAFEAEHAHWLGEWTLYATLKAENGGKPWFEWQPALAAREEGALAEVLGRTERERRYRAFIQLCFYRQWKAVREHARTKGIEVIGDLPMFVAHDSADVWARRELFRLDENGIPTHVSGAPPDDFNADGQVWGHPLFDWKAVEDSGWDFWVQRVRHELTLSDHVRLDHFVGYEAAWEVPFADAPSGAASGEYGPGPSDRLFFALESELGPLPFLAEDLGDVSDEAAALLERLGYPGMRVLAFAFGGKGGGNIHLPHNHPTRAVAYTGTHDNDTAQGWYDSLDSSSDERRRLRAYLGHRPKAAHWDLLRLAWQSVADTAIAPIQDMLGLGSRARMNRPGTATGNWRFRVRPKELDGAVTARLRALTELSGRLPEAASDPS